MTKPTADKSPPTPVSMWAIYENPTDYPGKFVVREWRSLGGVVQFAKDPLCVVDTLQQARAAVIGNRRDLLNIGRAPSDDPVIVEVWL